MVSPLRCFNSYHQTHEHSYPLRQVHTGAIKDSAYSLTSPKLRSMSLLGLFQVIYSGRLRKFSLAPLGRSAS